MLSASAVAIEAAAERAVRRWAGHRDLDDLRQVARIAAWQAAQCWDPGRDVPVDAWMGYRARGAVLDHYRSRHTVNGRTGRRARPETLCAELPEQAEEHDDDGLLTARQRALLDRLAALDLTARQRAVLDGLAAGHTGRAIATALGVSESAVSHHVRNIRAAAVAH